MARYQRPPGGGADLPAAALNPSYQPPAHSNSFDFNNPEIKRVKVMLAHTLKYINTGHGGQNAGYKSGALTIVFAGFTKDGNYVFAPGNMVPNHAVPCPRNCPDAGSAAQNLLQ
ncbi:MAG: hypothetical protein EOO04_25770 [Chitinophagaceae bacterium]|nr:MAG: hypothetical protein EOO04_25770 [Chitinophagaceae bacterium]